MDVMQKFRERLRRSSSSDVQSICISTIPDKVVTKGNEFATSQGVIRRYSIPAKTRLGSDVKPEGSMCQKSYFEGSKAAVNKESCGSPERQNILDAYKILQYEKAGIEVKLQNSQDKLKERDATIKELNGIIQQIKEDRLQDEEVRYQRSILAKRQYIDSLEAEIEKMKVKIEQDNIEVEKRVKKAKKQVARTKQECALKIFEIQQENASLKEHIKTLEVNIATYDRVRNDKADPESEPNKAPSLVNNCKSKHDLVVELSEQISTLIQENLILNEELQVANDKLLKYTSSRKSAKPRS
ncbi:uncharacterized protein LOC135687478 [Rhopilema esculentum]|uniref:uncharacterized protein LOC135687478 n=1 Tax=Rhopilema esculentum TaxID=499914 RepID=UPI0031DE9F39|eukprot:gene6240-11651_t